MSIPGLLNRERTPSPPVFTGPTKVRRTTPHGARRDRAIRVATARDQATRDAVVAVVADALQARPYDQVTYTFIAALAHVTAADVQRCFATKAEMVLSALYPTPAWSPRRALALSGAEIVTGYLEFWETADNAAILRCVCAASATDKRLAAAVEAHMVAGLIAPFAAQAPTPDACPRARLAVAALLGLALSRYMFRQEPLASADHETIAAWSGPALDYYLKGELGRTA
jgi:hypothetical protein